MSEVVMRGKLQVGMVQDASLTINIANPALFGKFKVGDKFYVDFTAAPDAKAAVEQNAQQGGTTES